MTRLNVPLRTEYIRDHTSGAVLNTDVSGYNQYKLARSKALSIQKAADQITELMDLVRVLKSERETQHG